MHSVSASHALASAEKIMVGGTPIHFPRQAGRIRCSATSAESVRNRRVANFGSRVATLFEALMN